MAGAKNPTVTHPECVVNGHGVCRFVMSWE